VVNRSTKGRLLLATPPLGDPNFDRSVVFMLEHGEQGALGVILNRPGTRTVADVLPRWAGSVVEPGIVFLGGPVETEALIGLGELPETIGGADVAVSASDTFSPVLGRIGTVDLSADPDDIRPRPARVRLFSGYAGWGAGQLDGELAAGAWIVLDRAADDAFSDRPTDLWRTVLGRQPGRLRWVAGAPDDLTLN
jgi:putative transcriptional regulator